jgi:prepilin-type N-terminal cleavage/methylation domain-containing protein
MRVIRSNGSQHPRRGFSLLEVVVVLTILGFVAGVTAPALRDATRKDDLTASAEAIVSLVDRTRRTAADYGTHATLTIDVESTRYWVFIETTSGERAVASGAISLAAGAELVARERRVTFAFDASGKAFASDVGVRLNGAIAPITVDPWRGDVRVGAP